MGLYWHQPRTWAQKFSGGLMPTSRTISTDTPDHFTHLARLLDLEARAEEEEVRRAARDGTAARDGVSLPAIILRESEFGLGGRLLLTFAPKSGPLPPTRLQPGAPVWVNQTGVNRRVPSYRGVVYDRDLTTIGVAIDPPDDDPPDDATWRLDLAADEAARARQQSALRRVAAAGGRLGELRGVLLGERAPTFDEPTTDEPAARLNPSQVDAVRSQVAAVRLALAAKDVAVIHGPPGTGKTTTVVDLIRRAVARGDRVLACAPSNHAVDHLMASLLGAGESPIRLGHPARVDPTL